MIAYYHRVLTADVPAFKAVGWRVVALDWSPSVGRVALMVLGKYSDDELYNALEIKKTAMALFERQHRENCEAERGND